MGCRLRRSRHVARAALWESGHDPEGGEGRGGRGGGGGGKRRRRRGEGY